MTTHCATCTCPPDERPLQPSTSDDRRRRVLIDGALQVVASKKRARQARPDTTEEQG